MSQTETWRHTILVKDGKSNEEAVVEIFPEYAGQGAYADKAGMVRVPIQETEPEAPKDETFGLPVVTPPPVIPEPEPTVTNTPISFPWWTPLLGMVPVLVMAAMVVWTWPKPVSIERSIALIPAPLLTLTVQPTWTATSTPAPTQLLPTQTAIVIVQTVVVRVPVAAPVQARSVQQAPAQPVRQPARVVQPPPKPQPGWGAQEQVVQDEPYIATGLDWAWRSIFDGNLVGTTDICGSKLPNQPSRERKDCP